MNQTQLKESNNQSETNSILRGSRNHKKLDENKEVSERSGDGNSIYFDSQLNLPKDRKKTNNSCCVIL